MVTRLSGLVSGMDTDTMVKNLMQAERVPLDQLKQKQQVLEWQRDDYRTLNSAFFDFRTTVSNMLLTPQYRVRTTDSSNEGFVTATASSGAGLSSYSIDSVTQLASAATRVTAAGISASSSSKIDPSKDLYSQSFAGTTASTWQLGTVKSQTISVTDTSNITLGTQVADTAAANVQVDGVNYKVVSGTPATDNEVAIDTTGKLTFSPTAAVKTGSTIKVDYVAPSTTDHYSSFSLQTYDTNGNPQNQTFLVNGSDSLNSVISKVNNSSVGVSMFYDSFSDKVTLTRKETGKFNNTDSLGEIQTSGDFINNVMGFGTSTETGGQNATFSINGLSTERTSNTFTMNGVTFTLKQTFDSAGTTGTKSNPVTISVKNDSDTVFNNIKSFIDSYNKLIDQVQGKLNEQRNKDYPPLTDDQKSTLSETQQDQWTEKAKSGLLQGDTTLSSALTQMRSLFYQPVQNANVSSTYNQLASIGITTTSNYMDGGKLQIDEAKLKQAIQNDPDSVENLFRASGDTTSTEGIAQRLYTSLNTTINNITAKAGQTYSTNNQFTIGRNLDDITSQITTMTDRLNQVEDRYYKQFDAMEQAMQQSNNQMTYLSSLMGGGQ